MSALRLVQSLADSSKKLVKWFRLPPFPSQVRSPSDFQLGHRCCLLLLPTAASGHDGSEVEDSHIGSLKLDWQFGVQFILTAHTDTDTNTILTLTGSRGAAAELLDLFNVPEISQIS